MSSFEYGIEHELKTPAGTVTFNVYDNPDGYLRLSGIPGAAMAGLRVLVENRPARHGAYVHPGLYGPLTPVFRGSVVERGSLVRRRELVEELEACLDSILDADGVWKWTPTGAAGRQRTVRLYERFDVEGEGARKDFGFALVAADPYAYSQELFTQATNTLGGGAGTSEWAFGDASGDAWAFGDASGDAWYFGEGASAGSASLSVGGKKRTYPVIRLQGGAMSGVTLRNLANGLVLALPTLTVAAGNFVDVDMQHEALYLNGDPELTVAGGLDAGTSWFWWLEPDTVNAVNLQAVTSDSGAHAVFYWRNAF